MKRSVATGVFRISLSNYCFIEVNFGDLDVSYLRVDSI